MGMEKRPQIETRLYDDCDVLSVCFLVVLEFRLDMKGNDDQDSPNRTFHITNVVVFLSNFCTEYPSKTNNSQ